MEPAQKLSALIAEYNTLRTEVVWARDNVWKAIQIGLPTAVGLIGYTIANPEWAGSLIPFTAIILIILGLTAFWNDQNTRAFSTRLRSIERTVNELVGGERLMIWESDHGWGSIFPPCGNPNFKGPPA